VRAARIHRWGGELRLEEAPEPRPAVDEVLVRVEACGVGLTVLNYTAGRWDGWTPFVTINSIADLQAAERRLIRHGRPGWLLGTLDTCLWAFSGTVLDRGQSLLELCKWVARGGSSGTLVNVLPGVMARYAAILGEMGVVDTMAAS